MSWIDRVQSDFTITCGDGSSFTPLWVNASKSVEYNLGSYEFPYLEGTLVKRRKVKGRQYNIEIIFQGEDHLDTALTFDRSAADPNPWTISHPLYGSLKVQPISLMFDNNSFNTTRITGTVIETIEEDAPKATESPEDKIASMKSITDAQLSTSFATEVPAPRVAVVEGMKANNLANFNAGKKILSPGIDAENYYNAFNNANSFLSDVSKGLTAPIDALSQVQNFLSAPVLFGVGVEARIKMFITQLNGLRQSLQNTIERPFKKIFEHNSGSIISSMAQTTVTNASYPNRKSALTIAQYLIVMLDQYMEDLDTLQSDNGGSPVAYIPDANSLIALCQLVNYAVSNLLQVAANSKQERIVYLPYDMNIIEATHKYFGLVEDDSTIEQFIEVNDIKMDEYLILRKDRPITYFV